MSPRYSPLPPTPPPRPWESSGGKDHDRSVLARELFAHREEILAHYPWVPLPNCNPGSTTPVAALILAWERWDYTRGDCPKCGGRALGLCFGGMLTVGVVSGVCTVCAHTVSRRNDGLSHARAGAAGSVQGTPYVFSFGSTSGRWQFKGIPQALVAVLQELGAQNLPKPSDGDDA